MHYLTVQDMLWLNLQVTQSVQRYRYADLEEATFYQYQYGQSTDVPNQAARFLGGFLAKAPFAEGNEATAVVAFHGFLALNGHASSVRDVETLVRSGHAHAEPGDLGIHAVTAEHGDDHAHDVASHRPTRAVLTHILDELLPNRANRV
ncbi:MAG: hypothetical protein SFX74_07110 [Fimbriimonadaceae bacterium]|nr:hypothetical protein [Fimbriimonadaceae bacterium]